MNIQPAVAEVRVFDPVRGLVPVPAGGDIEVSVAVNIENGSALTERSKPVAVPRRIVHGSVDLDRYKDDLRSLQRQGRYQPDGNPGTLRSQHRHSP